MLPIGDRIAAEFCKSRVAFRIKPGRFMAAAPPFKGLPFRVVDGRCPGGEHTGMDQEYEQIGRRALPGAVEPIYWTHCNCAAWFRYPPFCGDLSAPFRELPSATVANERDAMSKAI